MRVLQNPQMQVGEVDISEIKFDPKSRDDIPKVLKGLQYLYCDLSLRSQVFELLEREISPKVSKDNGRPGMALWRILVCGVLRLDLNIDYDRLHEMVNQHGTIRQMLGHGAFDLEPTCGRVSARVICQAHDRARVLWPGRFESRRLFSC